MSYENYSNTCKRFFLEITRSPYPGHIGKCLWAPIGKNWSIIEELAENDCIIHYISTRGRKHNQYAGYFIGISKVAEKPIRMDRKSLTKELEILDVLDNRYKEFAKTWLNNYSEFYFIKLKDYYEFPIKLKPDDVQSVKIKEKYITEIDKDSAHQILALVFKKINLLFKILDSLVRHGQKIITKEDQKIMNELRGIIKDISAELSSENPDKNKLKQLINSLTSFGKKIDWFWIIYSTPNKSLGTNYLLNNFLLNNDFRALFRKISNISNLNELFSIKNDIKSAFIKHPYNIRFVIFTSWLFLINPRFFAPASGEIFWDKLKGEKIDALRNILGEALSISKDNPRKWFWSYVHKSSKKNHEIIFDKYFIYLDSLHKVMAKNKLNDMIDVIYSIAKCVRDNNCLTNALYDFQREYFSTPYNPTIEKTYSTTCKKLSSIIQTINSALQWKMQVILYGPPGVGKTFAAINYAHCIDNTLYKIVTFHQSYSYEEFIEGFRPVSDRDNDSIRYEVVDGIFKRAAIKALWSLIQRICEENSPCNDWIDYSAVDDYSGVKSNVLKFIKKVNEQPIMREQLRRLFKAKISEIPKYVLVIDEINRGDISRIFGELITLLEKDKRLLMENQIIVKLPYSNEYFAVPPNLYIIGTMNSTDRSIALLDFALRRRFAFIEIEPDPRALDGKLIDGLNLKLLLETINARIMEKLDRDHRIGHSYFLEINNKTDLWMVWFYEIMPLLVEYFYGRLYELKEVLRGAENELLICLSDDTCYPKGPSEISENSLIEALKKIISNP